MSVDCKLLLRPCLNLLYTIPLPNAIISKIKGVRYFVGLNPSIYDIHICVSTPEDSSDVGHTIFKEKLARDSFRTKSTFMHLPSNNEPVPHILMTSTYLLFYQSLLIILVQRASSYVGPRSQNRGLSLALSCSGDFLPSSALGQVHLDLVQLVAH